VYRVLYVFGNSKKSNGHVWNNDVRRSSTQPHLLAVVQAWHFFLFSHIPWLLDETDAKKILTASPLGELEETTRMSLYYMDEYYPAGPDIQ